MAGLERSECAMVARAPAPADRHRGVERGVAPRSSTAPPGEDGLNIVLATIRTPAHTPSQASHLALAHRVVPDGT